MKALVLRSAGTNCDRETCYAFEKVGAAAETRHVNQLLAEPALLHAYRILVLPGGFSYGDDIAAGRVLATELRRRVLPQIRLFVERGGIVLGICNGFQVLVKTGLLPGGGAQTVTLAHNGHHRYMDTWVGLSMPESRCAFVKSGSSCLLPIAHAEGRLVADEETLDRLERNGQVVFRYVRNNPNGSMRFIAGICDETGRVLGMMPHPERHVEHWQHPFWTAGHLEPEPDGLTLFRNMVAAAT